MDIATLYRLFKEGSGISTDTRTIQPGMLFFALTGDRFDGHEYVIQALDKGAIAAVVGHPVSGSSEKEIIVEDVLDTLQKLAQFHRRQFNIPVLGITGSNGKTTTKELLVRVLATQFRVHYTKGNLNNHIGVPLTLLAMPDDTEIAVIEMGTNHPGEIALLSQIAAPDYGLITNIGKAHLEGLGSIEGVRKEKWALFDQVLTVGGTLFINQDDPRLADYPYEKVIRYGYSDGTDYRFAMIQSEPYISLEYRGNHTRVKLDSSLYGAYNAPNLMAAATVGRHFQVLWEAIQHAIKGYKPDNQRSQEMPWRGHQVLLDAYNANPTSMRAAIEYFAGLNRSSKVLVLGDMLELGDASEAEHRAILGLVKEHKWDQVFLVGPEFQRLSPDYLTFLAVSAMQTYGWAEKLKPGSLILIKGSRGIGLEKLLT